MGEFSDAQKRAIEHNKGPCLVLAGPGSGKTTVITNRTKQLIEQYGVNPARILVITFTKAAAEEMKQRFFALMKDNSLNVNFGTFHAVYFKILKYAYNYSASNIIREEDKLRYFREIIEAMQLDIEDEKEFIEGITSEISIVKSEKMDIDKYYSINCSEDNFKHIYMEYDKKLRNANLIDFDDMLVMCYELLAARPDILKMWQQKYEYILIDEFQDINKVQYDIIRLLAKPQDNIFIVGDDDQSIYRFRGAKPEIMLNFEKDYPNTVRILLDINYRSDGFIVEAALKVARCNKKRFDKQIKAIKPNKNMVKNICFNDLSEQNDAVLKNIQKSAANGSDFKDIAVLFRTNTQPRALVAKLMEYNIPFAMKDMLPNIYEHWITKNIIAYIKLALGERDRSLFLQVINRPKRYISREVFRNPLVSFNEIKSYYSDKKYVVERIEKLEYDLKMLKSVNPFAAINYIRRAVGYDEYLIEYAAFRRIKPEELFDIINELEESAREYNTFEEWFKHMEEYKIELAKQAGERFNSSRDAVAMMTFHASKGLEFEKVIIVDANETITPHRKAVLLEDLEEERRMFYVAMTRAKSELYIYSVKRRYGKELSISRFVGEMLADEEAFKVGAVIEHRMYGKGKVIQNKDGRVSIKFENNILPKTLDIEFCVKNNLIKKIKLD